MLMLFFVWRVTASPAPSSASTRLARSVTSPASASATSPAVICCAASTRSRGRSEPHDSARRFSGSSGSCSPCSAFASRFHASIRGRSWASQ